MSQTNPPERDSPANYPSGHLNHLTADQENAFQEFKNLLRDNDCYVPLGDYTTEDYFQETLLRFLRARGFVPKDALKQYQDTVNWRKEQDIDGWYNVVDLDDYEQTRKLYTHWTGRRDKRGIPLYVFDIGTLDIKKINNYKYAPTVFNSREGSYDLSLKLRHLFATYEHLTDFVLPLCSLVPSKRSHPDVPISQTCNIVDISHVSLRQFWSLKSHLQDASALATAHYPETLGRTFIVGAPSFFPPIWNWLKGWFDPITVAKVFILADSEVKTTLEQFIEADDIPKKYGGKLEWAFGDEPDIDQGILDIMKMEDDSVKIPGGPIRLKNGESKGQLVAHALGSEKGEQSEQRDRIVARILCDNLTSDEAEHTGPSVQSAEEFHSRTEAVTNSLQETRIESAQSVAAAA